MPNKVWTVDFSANYPVVKAQGVNTQFRALDHLLWGRWEKFTTKDKKAVTPSGSVKAEGVTNSPIVVHRELGRQPGHKLEIPMFRDLKEISKHGSQILSGTGEKRKINFAHVYINTIRAAEEVKEGSLNEHILQKYGIPGSARQALARQYARQLNFLEIPYAMYMGLNYSVMLDAEISANDANIAVTSHPNFYVVGQGKIDTGYAGTSTREQAIATAIDALGPGNNISGGFLKALNTDDQMRRIPYLYTKLGQPFRVLILDKYGMAALRNDSDVKALHNNLFVQNVAKENPMLTGMELFYEGWAIFDGGNSIYPLDTADGLPVYGPVSTRHQFNDLDDFNDVSTFTKWGAIVLGDNALMKATGWDMKYTGEVRDHGEIEEVGYNIGLGYARPDYRNRDDGNTGQFTFNDTSAIVAYYATKPNL